MVEAHQLLKAGRLTDAISSLEDHIRKTPSDHQAQTFLYELLCFTGDFDRAERQLDVVESESSPEALSGIQRYRLVLHAERDRQRAFLQQALPRQLVNGGVARFSGTLNGRSFLTLSDADPRIGDKLEVFLSGEYVWISLSDVRRLHVPAPRRLRDLLWLPAGLEVVSSLERAEMHDAWLPMMAPLTWQHTDEEVRLGRISEWRENQFGDFAPYGIKTYLADGAEVPLAEIRELVVEPAGYSSSL